MKKFFVFLFLVGSIALTACEAPINATNSTVNAPASQQRLDVLYVKAQDLPENGSPTPQIRIGNSSFFNATGFTIGVQCSDDGKPSQPQHIIAGDTHSGFAGLCEKVVFWKVSN